jgi:3-oxoacyl-[acyl-carrier protein] reductase
MAATAAVIGGSGGLGAAICRVLAAEGWALRIGYHLGVDAAQQLVEAIRRDGGIADAQQVDVRDAGSVDAFLAPASGGELRAVINAVGPPIPLRPLTEVSPAEFRAIVETDVLGAFNVLTAAARRMAACGGGSIVQLLTTAVLRTLENDGMSGIPKTAIMGIVRQLARDVGAAGVRINAIAPGVIDAGIVHESFTADSVAQDVIRLCLERTPAGRMGRPEDVGALAAFLLRDSAAYINGQIIGIDGGYSA